MYYCKSCDNEIPERAYKKTKLCTKCYNRDYNNKTRNKGKKSLASIGCVVCNETHYACLEVHHLHPKYKRFGRSQGIFYNIEDLEIGHAVVLCANCHNLFHASWGGKNQPFPELTKEETVQRVLHFRKTGG